MTYAETIDYLYRTAPLFQHIGGAAYKGGLDTSLELDRLQEHPHRAYRTIHVGGTNGKGSVSQMLYGILRAAGYRTGLYTSPHLRDFRERMEVDGELIPEQQVIDFVETMRPEIERLRPSFFEITTAMAFDFFRQQQVDVAVIEVGLGGRLDCTNIIRPEASIITNISSDHTAQLGHSLAEIAAEKAGIIKAGIPVVVGEYDPATAPVFEERARQVGAPLRFASRHYRCDGHADNRFAVNGTDYELGMRGDYQGLNLCTALAAVDVLRNGFQIDENALRQGLRSARVRGRWQQLSEYPTVLCDTGHNVAGIRFVVDQLARQPRKKLYFVLGVVADKELDAILPLLPRDAYYLFTQASIPRALPAGELAAQAGRFDLSGEVVPTVPEALARARALAGADDLIFVGGSTFTVAEVIE